MSLGDRERLRAGAFEVEIKLRVRVALGEPFGEHQRQSRLAHAPHALQAGDDCPLLDPAQDFVDFLLAPREITRRRRDLVQCASGLEGLSQDLGKFQSCLALEHQDLVVVAEDIAVAVD